MSKHNAKFSAPILARIAAVLDDWMDDVAFHGVPLILDPFAGVGGVHTLREACDHEVDTIGVEIQPLWAREHVDTVCADFFNYNPAWLFDAVVTSPAYGNRMADKHNAKDGTDRITYAHTLRAQGEELHPNNSGGLQWGPKYRAFHVRAWRKVFGLIRPGGLFILNVSNHIRNKVEVPVAEWHRDQCVKLGFELVRTIKVPTKRMKKGENAEARVAHEMIYVFRRP